MRTLVPVTDYEVVTAKGVKGVFDGVEYRIGQRSFFDLTDDAQTEIENMHETGATMVLFGTVNRIHSVFFIKDTLREEAGSVIRTLEQMNIDTVMLTGDHKSVAETIGKEIGLTQVHAGLLPEDKLDIIKIISNMDVLRWLEMVLTMRPHSLKLTSVSRWAEQQQIPH